MRHDAGALLLVLAGGCGPEVLTQVEDATRVGEVANGDLLVGTSTGRLIGVNGFGETWVVEEDLGGAVREIAANPLGVWWVLLDDGRLLRGTPWSPARQDREGILGVLQTCEGLTVGTRTAPGLWADASTVALGPSCEEALATGTSEGYIGNAKVTANSLTRLIWQGQGYLWVDDAGGAGCEGCASPMPEVGVQDACTPHGVPFLEGEIVWLDRNGTLWIE